MDLEVKPANWVLPNRIGYNEFVYKTFHPSKYEMKEVKKKCECDNEVCDVSSSSIMLFPQQRIVRDYIQIDSPYRGILLYHELGSGKSAASIAAAEGYIERKNVFIMTPSSLAQNYENELMKISKIGLSLKKSWSLLKVSNTNAKKEILQKYAISSKFIKNNLVWVPLYNDDIEGAMIVQDKKSYKSLIASEKLLIDEIIRNIISNRYQFVSYNGLTQASVAKLKKNTFDGSLIVIDEIHNFISRVVNGSKLARGLYNAIMNANDCKLVLLSGTPIINNPYEIASLINLIRGTIKQFKLRLLKNSQEKTTSEIVQILNSNNMYKYIDDIRYDTSDKSIRIILLPNGYVRDSENIVKESWKYSDEGIIDLIIKKFNSINGFKVGVKSSSDSYYALPSNIDEFNKTFIDDSDAENLMIKNNDLFQRRILGTLSFYKTSGTELFPEVLPNKIQYLDMTMFQMNSYTDVRDKERKMDDVKKKSQYKQKHDNPLADKSSVYRAFSRMVCNFAFPEKIKRKFPQDIKNMMKKEIDTQDSDDEDEINTEQQKEILKKSKNEYEESLNKAIAQLDQGDYLSKESLGTLYSPKYAKMMNDIEESPGTVLVYSQFRKVEGLGIFSKALDKNGYKEVTIKKTDKGYEFEDLSVFDSKYDNKRYVIFNSDRIKTNILMNLFNGSFTLLPESIRSQLSHTEQQYGKLIKVMMITQSGAEGISLKNVRRVLIMEYFWNAVRINQVIGRAVRTCSHETLPKEDRNVQIFTYIMRFTKQQLEKDFTLRTLDKGMTTDEHILQLANKKEKIIFQFLDMLKAASFDCIINSVQNKPKLNGYKCYNWAINVNKQDLAYTGNIHDDKKIMKHKKLEVVRKNKGKVVVKDGVKYVLMNNEIYDYFSYKNAGILVKA